MRIADVTAYELSSPIEPPDERSFYGGSRRILKRDIVLVRLDTPDGTVGYATAGASSSEMREYFEDVDHGTVAEIIESVVAPVLMAEPLESIGVATERIHAELDLPTHLRWQIASAIDVALYDIEGKRRGMPIHELLAPDRTPDLEIPLYASSGMYMEPDGYAEQAAALREQGFVGYKYRPGGGPERDRRTIRRIRNAVDDDFEIMVDAHTWWKLGDRSYDVEQVVELLADFAQYDPYWIEEPVRPDAKDAYRTVATRTDLPLAGGESEHSPSGLRELADTGALAFLQPDVRHHGGFTGVWEIAQYCVGRDVRLVPHNFGTHLGLIANAHLVAAAPESDLLEYPIFGTDTDAMYPFPLATEILETSLDLSEGQLSVPTEPGLGVDIDLGVIDRYPPIDGPWTEFEYE